MRVPLSSFRRYSKSALVHPICHLTFHTPGPYVSQMVSLENKSGYVQVEMNTGGSHANLRSEVAWIRRSQVLALLGCLAAHAFLWITADVSHESPRGDVYWPDPNKLTPLIVERSSFPRVTVAFLAPGLAVLLKAVILLLTHWEDSSIASDLVQRYWPKTCFEVSAMSVVAYTLLTDAVGERDVAKQIIILALMSCSHVFQWMAESFARAEIHRVEVSSARIMFGLALPPFALAWATMFRQMKLSSDAMPTTTAWDKWRVAMPILYASLEGAMLLSTATRVQNIGYEWRRVCVETVVRAAMLMGLCLTVGQT